MGPEVFGDMGDMAFQMTMQQNPTHGSLRTYQQEWIELCKDPSLVMGPENLCPNGYVRCVAMDPSGGVKKGAIIVADVGTTDQGFIDVFLREILHERMDNNDTERNLAGLFSLYSPKLFVWESSAITTNWEHMLIDVARRYGVRHQRMPTAPGRGALVRDPGPPVTIEPGAPASYAADVQFGRIHIPWSNQDLDKTESTLKQARRLVTEMESFPDSRTTDCLMALFLIKDAWQRGLLRAMSGKKKSAWPTPSWVTDRWKR